MTHPFDRENKYCLKHKKDKQITRRQVGQSTVITLECSECATVARLESALVLLGEAARRIKNDMHPEHPPASFADCIAAECDWARRVEEFLI